MAIMISDDQIKHKPLRINYVKAVSDLPACYKKIEDDAGYDLFAIEDKWIWPFTVTSVLTNLSCEIPKGYFGRVSGRSGSSMAGILTIPGTIDPGFTGFMSAMVTRIGLFPKKIHKGDRIAQLIIMPCAEVDWNEVKALKKTIRGANKFGHTGIGSLVVRE